MKPSNVVRLYRVRLRARLWQECFAIVGIAAGVALLFASQVSNASLQSAVAALSRGIAGDATLQLLARDPHGFPQSTLAHVRRVPGVRTAAPLLEAQADASGPRGSRSVLLVGADESLSRLDGTLVRRDATLAPFGRIGAVVLPSPLARAIGVTSFGKEVKFRVAGRTTQAPLYAQLGRRQIGVLTATPVAVVPLSFAQEMTGLPARVTRILVQPAPGAERRVRAALLALAGGRLNVEPIGHDEAQFAKAAAASNQSTQLFAVISALVGFLFAFNAMLFTVPQRRRLVAELRREGYSPRTVLAVLSLDALVLGVLAVVFGLALGDELSIHVLHSNPAFLSLAFAFGSQRAVTWQSIALAGGGGMLAALAAVLGSHCAMCLRAPATRWRTRARAPGAAATRAEALARRPRLLSAAPARSCSRSHAGRLPEWSCSSPRCCSSCRSPSSPRWRPSSALPARSQAPPLTSPRCELGSARGRERSQSRRPAQSPCSAASPYSGAHDDLLTGLERAAHEANAATDVWVAPKGGYDLFDTAAVCPRRSGQSSRACRAFAPCRVYRGGLLDYGERRVLVIAPPREASPLLAGGADARRRSARDDRARALRRLARALSRARRRTPPPCRPAVHAADARPADVPGCRALGERRLGARRGDDERHRLRTRLGQRRRERVRGRARPRRHDPPQALHDRRARARGRLGAHGADGSAARHAAGRAEPPSARAADADRDADPARCRARDERCDGRADLAAPAAPSQAEARRARRGMLWRTILLESLLLLGVGCSTGAVFGLYGQQLADRALAEAVNFPIDYSASAARRTGLRSA